MHFQMGGVAAMVLLLLLPLHGMAHPAVPAVLLAAGQSLVTSSASESACMHACVGMQPVPGHRIHLYC
jgi:hypothetical protein